MSAHKKELKNLKDMESCPICLNGRFLNRLSKDGFYCTSCLNEFKMPVKIKTDKAI
jgi:ribosomal protein L37AE/L43A